ncbi:bifunctional peptidase and arginyl-hydroxylase JMJD5-like [Liolophura sinensis]|uniref:bifunctional peptidase and arginyl-hydroxylase JMJD5-like n=1 Tax=Liolophura sinensis TaxID=3198878 RepID=UPI003158AB37
MSFEVSSSLVITLFAVYIYCTNGEKISKDLTLEPGHLQKFGTGRPSKLMDEVEGFPSAQEFFHNYVSVLRPLKMTGAAKLSRAFHQWTDDYFTSLQELDAEDVLIESRKKENRTNPTSFMTLRQFVKIYNDTDQYMVNSVPRALRPDMVFPCPAQCESVVNGAVVDALMWFSSGGTKSVVHTDAVENINCLIRGDKEFVMIDPLLYGDKVDMDHPEGSYSDVDVDAVDYTKYPGLAEVEFVYVNMTAGDCLYIPYRWIHQVRSYNSNLAVNIWWDHHKTADIDSSLCPQKCDYDLTLDKVNYIGFGAALNSEESLKDHILQMIGIHSEITEKKFMEQFLGQDEPDESHAGVGYKDLLLQIFKLLDLNKDTALTKQELNDADKEIWENARDILLRLETLLNEIEKDLEEEYDENPDAFDEEAEILETRDEL